MSQIMIPLNLSKIHLKNLDFVDTYLQIFSFVAESDADQWINEIDIHFRFQF